MEYTVGSLADLISGQNTPNKPRVKKIAVKTKSDKVENSIISEKITKRKKSKKSVEENVDTANSRKRKASVSMKKSKKHKMSESSLADSDEETSPEEPFDNANAEEEKPRVKKIAVKTQESDEDENSLIPEKMKRKKAKKSKKPTINESSLADSDEETSPGEPGEPIDNSNVEDENKKKKKKEKREPDPEELARTIFVGNVPIKTDKKRMKRHFKKYGSIEALRFRGIPVANLKMPKKVAAIKKDFHPDRNSVYCYIKFVNKEDAQKATAENGSLFEEHHLRVHSCAVTEKPDESKAIFIGNLGFSAEEEELWKLFESCGPISHIRIIRDSYTGMSKGFAYVNFQDSDAVQLALEMEGVKLGNRELRIKPSSVSSAKKQKTQKIKSKPRWRNSNQNKNENNSGNNGEVKNKWKKPNNMQNKCFQGSKFNPKKKNNNENNSSNNGEVKNKWNKPNNMQNKDFQGAKFNPKKKNKVNKGLIEKKRNIKKIAPISK